ncbi:endonuclease/exonuclease/phosphatase family protein [Blastococcus saxobsidens]|uniref:Putative endonuclease/exonuclease/phosphatase family protein n=1 Tax=Blastococcus saxobsidens (strain DD2) TaxID=1146883 RepID=H6RT53_BLASD|nr:endonuclease/exonuclease/phosphatase family protein [Blastococcus saxobsidens]CCG04356.1 Putative endonuclease/exonuclease/phosphatase family protein [Blastococcus saxobsidens DD2]
MLIGTWNVNLRSSITSTPASDKAAWIQHLGVDVWLLAEVHADWRPRGRELIVSPERQFDPGKQRWAGIDTCLPHVPLRTAGDPEHAGEESLVLARLQVDDAKLPTVLVACSVLPWKNPGDLWPRLPGGGQAEKFRHILDHHVRRIDSERQDGEPLIWGGDFNQHLNRPFEGATVEGQKALREGFSFLGLLVLTERAEHLDPGMYSIDHLAVSSCLVAGEQIAGVHRPAWEGRKLSDHPAYTAIVGLQTPCGRDGAASS